MLSPELTLIALNTLRMRQLPALTAVEQSGLGDRERAAGGDGSGHLVIVVRVRDRGPAFGADRAPATDVVGAASVPSAVSVTAAAVVPVPQPMFFGAVPAWMMRFVTIAAPALVKTLASHFSAPRGPAVMSMPGRVIA